MFAGFSSQLRAFPDESEMGTAMVPTATASFGSSSAAASFVFRLISRHPGIIIFSDAFSIPSPTRGSPGYPSGDSIYHPPGRSESHLGNLLGNIAHELGGTGAFSNITVANTPSGKKNNAGVAAVDSIGKLPFHLMQLPAFPRPQRPCHDLVHRVLHITNRLLQQPMWRTYLPNTTALPLLNALIRQR
jgi:hypothetical protein